MGELLFSNKYTLDKKTAYDAIVKRYFCEHRVKVIVEAALLSILAVVLAVSAFSSDDTMSILLFLVSIIALASVFFSPMSQAKMSAAVFESGVEFELSLFENAVCIQRSEQKTEMSFDSISKLLEIDDYIYIFTASRFFPIPKSDFSVEQQKKLREVFEEKLQNRYKNKQKTVKTNNKQ